MYKDSLLSAGEHPPHKRLNTSNNQKLPEKDLSLALQLVSNFSSLDPQLKLKILGAVESLIQQDSQLLALALRQQVSLHVHQARELFEQRRLGPLEDLLSSLAPAAAIMLNIEISLVSATYTEESATLARTLLPFIDRVTDYRFLGQDSSFIANRFLSALALHIKDIQGTVSAGFVAFALHVNPTLLKSIITSRGSLAALRQVLLERGFQTAAVNVMCLYPAKFLWPDLLSFWHDKSPETVTSCAEILARMDVLTDPGEQMESLVAVLAQRSLLTKCLIGAGRINMSFAKLVRILERLALLDS